MNATVQVDPSDQSRFGVKHIEGVGWLPTYDGVRLKGDEDAIQSEQVARDTIKGVSERCKNDSELLKKVIEAASTWATFEQWQESLAALDQEVQP